VPASITFGFTAATEIVSVRVVPRWFPAVEGVIETEASGLVLSVCPASVVPAVMSEARPATTWNVLDGTCEEAS